MTRSLTAARPRARSAVLAAATALAAAVSVGAVAAGMTSATASTSVSNPGLESWSSGKPTCWQLGGPGSGSVSLSATSDAHSGSYAAKLTASSLTSGNRKLVTNQKSSTCAPTVAPGHTYKVSFWYQSTVSPIISVYYRDSSGKWHWWEQSGRLGTTSTWTAASFSTAAVPSGATALSFGGTITSSGTLVLDDASLSDLSAATPTTSLSTTSTAAATSTASTPSSPTATGTATSSPTATTSASPTSTSTPSPTTSTTTATASPSPTATTTTSSSTGPVLYVSTASELTNALSSVNAGTTIQLADGVYKGNFTLSRSGTSTAPITITGSRNAVLDGGTTSSGYVLHLDKANYVTLKGFAVRDGQKAIVLDQATHNTLSGLEASYTGEEIVLLRNYSTDNTVTGCEIHDSGHTTAGYGEGVYVGLAVSNWSSSGQSRTNGGPDTSDRNSIVGNHIYDTTAENVDIKEGTSNGLVANNNFDSTGMTGANYADSWVDVAGNGWTIRDNNGVNPGSALLDGYQTHVQVSGWAQNNVFSGNTSSVNAAGYAINIDTRGSGNVVYSSDTETGAAKGLTNVSVTP